MQHRKRSDGFQPARKSSEFRSEWTGTGKLTPGKPGIAGLNTMKIVICALGILFSSGNLVQETRANDSDPLNVFILAGQSNMAGADSVSLQFRLDARVRSTLFTSTALSTDSSFLAWGPLRRQNVKGQLVHGPEIGLAHSLQRAGYRRLAMIKVHANFGRDEKAWPWRPDGRLFKQWMAFVNDRLQELRDQGHSVRVRGFIWHQGIDDAIHRGFDKQTEKDLSRPGNFISNFQCLDEKDARQQMSKTLTFEKYTDPMRNLILASSQKEGEESQFVSSANPRIVDGKPTKNPRYLQTRPEKILLPKR